MYNILLIILALFAMSIIAYVFSNFVFVLCSYYWYKRDRINKKHKKKIIAKMIGSSIFLIDSELKFGFFKILMFCCCVVWYSMVVLLAGFNVARLFYNNGLSLIPLIEDAIIIFSTFLLHTFGLVYAMRLSTRYFKQRE